MDDYSLLGIFELVEEPGDLASVASGRPRVRDLIIHYNLISNIRNETFDVLIKAYNRKQDVVFYSFGDSNSKTRCSNSDHVLAILEAFCPEFSQLNIVLNYEYAQGDFAVKFIDHVNRYCSTVSQKLSIQSEYRNQMLTVQESTAWNVSSVEIEWPENLANFSIARHFPRVEALAIQVVYNFTTTEHLPHLKHFDYTDYLLDRFNYRAFIEKNPQITSVRLGLGGRLEQLQAINELLPNLVSLYYRPRIGLHLLHGGETVVRSVRFRNVKTYTIDVKECFSNSRNGNNFPYEEYFANFSSIVFDQLETFQYVSERFYGNGQLKFIGQYNQVKSLDISSYPMSFNEVRQLVDSMPNLKDITVRLVRFLTRPDDFLRLMAETNLETIQAHVDSPLARTICANTLREQWSLCEFDNYREILTLRRNKNNSIRLYD